MFPLIRRVPLSTQVGTVAPKPHDKRLRLSQTMPLVNIKEIYAQSKPVYKGKHPLKVSDVQLVVDSHGCPNALVQHPAFDPVVEETTFSGPIEQPSRRDVLDLFPAPPPSDMPLPRRPKVIAPPLYDELYNNILPPNPASARQRLLSAPRAEITHESYHQPIDISQSTSSHRSHRSHHSRGVVQAQAFTKTALFRQQQEGGRPFMMHSNYSTKSLDANVRIRDGPARRVIVNPPARYEHRPEPGGPRQRHTSNASTTHHGAEFGYIGQDDCHYHKIPSCSRPLKSSSHRP